MSAEAYESLLKDDPGALISLLLERDEAIAERDETIAAKEQEIDKLHHLLIQAKKHLYGRKSEKLTPADQTELFSFTPTEEPKSEEPSADIEVAGHTRTKRKARTLPDTIERERIEYDLDSPLCPCCSAEMAVIGEELSEELEFIPAKFKIYEHVRLKRACGSCKNGVYVPTLPPEVKPLERRSPGAGLLTQIVISKYLDHLPLYRQEQIWRRHAIELPRRVMCGWLEGVAELLTPLYDELKKQLLNESYLQADETTLKVQDPELSGKLHTGYLWGFLGPPGVYFHYADSRASEVPKKLFGNYAGSIQTDAYAGYNPVFLPESCERIACLAHIRRKFIEARDTSKSAADRVLVLIAELYKLERQFRELPAGERYVKRKKKSLVYLKKLYRLIRQQRRTALPSSPYRKALNYAWEQRTAMLQFLRDGRFEIDNNRIENQMRPIALGRKNYLFAGSHDGARRAAVFYSLLGSCKLHGVNAFDWLSDVLRRIYTPGVTAAELLPQNWRKA